MFITGETNRHANIVRRGYNSIKISQSAKSFQVWNEWSSNDTYWICQNTAYISKLKKHCLLPLVSQGSRVNSIKS